MMEIESVEPTGFAVIDTTDDGDMVVVVAQIEQTERAVEISSSSLIQSDHTNVTANNCANTSEVSSII